MMGDRFAFSGDVVFGQRDLSDKTPSFAHVELERKMLFVVREFILWKLQFVRELSVFRGDFRVVLEKPDEAEGQIADSLADLIPGGFVAFDVAAILLGERETERAGIHVDVGLVIRNISDRKGADQGVEMQGIVAPARLENFGTGEAPGFEIVEVAEINRTVVTRQAVR